MSRSQSSSWWTCVALLACLSGCSSELPLYSVKGQVVYKDTGEPFSGGTPIVFESKQPPYHRAMGDLDNEGRFELATEQRAGTGAMEGPHRVSISYVATEGDVRAKLSKMIDDKYFEFRTSGIEVDIKPDQANDFKIELERARPSK